MKTYKIKSNQIEKVADIVLALGFFDGIHLGHQKIINQAKKIAAASNLKSAVLTFTKSPKDIIQEKDNSNLFGVSDKRNVLESMGIDYLIVLDLTKKDLLNITAQEFVSNFIQKLGAQKVVCGADYTYGKDREGSALNIQEYSNNEIDVTIEEIETMGDRKISSSTLKKHLKENELKQAKDILGRNFCVHGTVVHGNKVGRELGFKTANLEIEDDFSVLLSGVFAVKVQHNNKDYFGVCNVGIKPTFNNCDKKTIEAFMFDFDEQIYGQKINIEFLKFLRKEHKFDSAKDLSKQIAKDILQAKMFFSLK